MNKYLFFRYLSALIYPERCPICNKIISADEKFCIDCTDELVVYKDNFRVANVKKFTAAFIYNEKISPAIFIMKDSISGNAPYALGFYIAERIKSEKIEADFLVPVPMFRKDKKKRGYNQSELIAKNVGRFLDMEVRSDVVIKNRKTEQQKHLNFAQRKKNLKDAFSVTDVSAVRGKRIIIIDDICTTGSTLSEIAALLVSSGAAEIYCACACKTMKKDDKKGTS